MKRRARFSTLFLIAGACIALNMTTSAHADDPTLAGEAAMGSLAPGWAGFWRHDQFGWNTYSLLTDGTNVFVNAPSANGTIYFRGGNGGTDSTGSRMNLDANNTLNIGGGLIAAGQILSTGTLVAHSKLLAEGNIEASFDVKVGGTLTTRNAILTGNLDTTGLIKVTNKTDGTTGFDLMQTEGGIGGRFISNADTGTAISALGGNTGIRAVANKYAVYANSTLYAIYVQSGDVAKPGGGSWSATSDARVKQDVTDFNPGLSELEQLRPVSYKYNGLGGTQASDKVHVGVIAQDLEKVLPGMVTSKKQKLRDTDKELSDIKQVDPSAFTYVLINAVKDLAAKNRRLQEQVNSQNRTLEAQVAALMKIACAERPKSYSGCTDLHASAQRH